MEDSNRGRREDSFYRNQHGGWEFGSLGLWLDIILVIGSLLVVYRGCLLKKIVIRILVVWNPKYLFSSRISSICLLI